MGAYLDLLELAKVVAATNGAQRRMKVCQLGHLAAVVELVAAVLGSLGWLDGGGECWFAAGCGGSGGWANERFVGDSCDLTQRAEA